MELFYENSFYKLYKGSMLDMLDYIEPNSIGSIVTDPPYELNFMGKGWDNAGVSFNADTWEKCYEVLKPGGYLLAFGGSRTYHRIACAIEDAGFEIRDTIMWLYGSGFPKSMSLGKVCESKMINGSANVRDIKRLDGTKTEYESSIGKFETEQGYRDENYTRTKTEVNYQTELGKKWDGWGTALKPAFEPVIVARKPFKGTLVDNVIANGVGGINIDECRVEFGNEIDSRVGTDAVNTSHCGFWSKDKGNGKIQMYKEDGRFPANVILTYDQITFDEVCGGFPTTKGTKVKEKGTYGHCFNEGERDSKPMADGYDDEGSACRYFYCAKASKKDRNSGLDEYEDKIGGGMSGTQDQSLLTGSGNIRNNITKNTHPTVKPTTLMQYLVRLVTPKGETILDPFNGSGSTGKAIMYENNERNANYKYIGIDLSEEYLNISRGRINYAIFDN